MWWRWGCFRNYSSVNTLTTDSNDNCYHLVTFKGTNRNIDGYLLESDGTLQGDVELNNDNNILDRAGDGDTGCTAGTSNEITRIQGIMPMNLKITPETSGLQIRYNNTRGIKVDMSSTNNVIFKWDSAFFDFELIAK